MKTQNKVQLIGYLGADPVVRKSTSGFSYATMRLATDELIPKLNAQPEKITTWHDISVWGEAWMPFVENHLLKGSHILVEGPICHRQYEDRTGKMRYRTEIKARHIMNLDR